MTDAWRELAEKSGRVAVMSREITEAELTAETVRQWDILAPMLNPLLTGSEQLGLDYGCGAGRFTAAIAALCGGLTIGYDPCREMLALAPKREHVRYTARLPLGFEFDLIFTAMVLGDPNVEPDYIAGEIAGLLAPNGLLIVLDHMPDEAPKGRWWQFRAASFYRDLFARHGIGLSPIGRLMQLQNEVTVLAGHRTA